MKIFTLLFILSGCVTTYSTDMSEFDYVPIKTKTYEIATWQRIKNHNNPRIHSYIEGDGNSFNAYGRPTIDPTPRNDMVRKLAEKDSFDNVVYMARPCQFIMDEHCKTSDWTTGRFSQDIIDAQSETINKTAKGKIVTLIGYSGGAMVSGLIIKQNSDINFEKWITIAGVLNHQKWTQYFGDVPLTESLDMDILPNINQIHFIGGKDTIVPYDLAKQWAPKKDIVIMKNATHNDFGDITLFDK